MDFLVINTCITDCISNLSGLHSGNRIGHGSKVLLAALLRNKADHCGNSLWDCLGWYYNDLLVLSQISCLVSCKDNILVIRENINCFCIYFLNSIEHVFGTRIHSLTAFDQIIYAKLTENLRKSLTYGYGNKSMILWRFFVFCLFFCKFFRIFDQFFLMFFSHIVNLHAGKLTIRECAFKSLSRMIGVHVYLDNLIISYQNNGITDGIQKFTETVDLILWKRFFKKDNKLCTISKFDICLCLRRNLCDLRSCCFKLGIIHFFSMISVDGTTENFQKSLSARIHNTCFFQDWKHLWCSGKSFLCMLKDPVEKSIQIFCSISKLCCSVCCSSGYSKNGSLFWFHNCLVCSFNASLHSCGNGRCIQICKFTHTSGKSTQKL